jgi:hypothetical protein
MPKQLIRFTFAITTGPCVGLTTGGWRLWVHGDDTYIADKAIGAMWKTSLHGNVAWRLAATQEAMAGEAPPVPPGTDRALWKFDPPPFVNGGRRAFFVAATRGCLRPDRLDERDVVIEVDDRWDQMTYAMVWMTEPTFRLVHPRIIDGPLSLASGRNVWLTAGAEALPPCDPEPIPASSMAEPLWPEKHGVPCPGIVVRGVHLQSADQHRQALDESV